MAAAEGGHIVAVPLGMPVLRQLLDILWRERDLMASIRDAELRAPAGRAASDAVAAAEALVACHDVDLLVEQVAALELARAIKTRALAEVLGVDDYPTLTRLIELCPPAWAQALGEHRHALRRVAGEVHVAAEAGARRLETAGVVGGSAAAGRSRAPVPRSMLDFLE